MAGRSSENLKSDAEQARKKSTGSGTDCQSNPKGSGNSKVAEQSCKK